MSLRARLHGARVVLQPAAHLALLALALLVAAVAQAERRAPPPSGATLGRAAFQTLERAQELLAAGRPAEAAALLEPRAGRGSSYEQAVLQQSLGIALEAAGRGEAAIAAFRAALDTGGLPPESASETTLRLGQLQLRTGHDEAGIATLQGWLDAHADPPASALVLVGNAHARVGAHARASELVEQGLAKAGDPPAEWLRLAAQLRLVQSDYARALPHLEALCRVSAEETDWDQLVAVYRTLGRGADALAAAQLSLALGHRSGAAARRELAELLVAAGRPLEAAEVLEQGMASGAVPAEAETLSLLGRALRLAREGERAREPLARAARADGAPARWLELAELELELEHWQAAERALRRALERARGEDRARAELRLGMALAEQGDRAAAREAFGRAASHPTTRRDALRWQASLDAARPLAGRAEERGRGRGPAPE